MSTDRLRVFTSGNVLLPGAETPLAATIEVDADDGRIRRIYTQQRQRTDYPSIPDSDWIDAGDHWILPGLVECAL